MNMNTNNETTVSIDFEALNLQKHSFTKSAEKISDLLYIIRNLLA